MNKMILGTILSLFLVAGVFADPTEFRFNLTNSGLVDYASCSYLGDCSLADYLFGGETPYRTINVGNDTSFGNPNAWFKFNTSILPSNWTIVNATMTTSYRSVTGSDPKYFGIYQFYNDSWSSSSSYRRTNAIWNMSHNPAILENDTDPFNTNVTDAVVSERGGANYIHSFGFNNSLPNPPSSYSIGFNGVEISGWVASLNVWAECIPTWSLSSNVTTCFNTTHQQMNETYTDTNGCEADYSDLTYTYCGDYYECSGGVCSYVGYCGDSICQPLNGETTTNCCQDCGVPEPFYDCTNNVLRDKPTERSLSHIGSGMGNLFTGFGVPLMIFILLMALGSAIGYMMSSLGTSVGSKV
jgi:hypothetical protein